MLPLSCQAVADKCVQQMQQAGLLSLRLCPKAKPPPSTEGGKRCAGSKEVRKRYWKREGQDRSPTVWGGRRAISDRPYGCGGERRMANGHPYRYEGSHEGAGVKSSWRAADCRPYGGRGGRADAQWVSLRGAVVDRRTPNGERPDRRQWREEGGERVVAVGERRRCVSTKDIRRAPQQDHPYGCGGRMGKGGSRPSPTSKWKTENGE